MHMSAVLGLEVTLSHVKGGAVIRGKRGFY